MSQIKNSYIDKFPLFLCLYEVAVYLSNDMYLPALPEMMQDLNTTPYLAQFTLISWLIGTASTQLVLGPISDRYGRRPVLLISGIVFVIASTICATAPNIMTLLIGRFIQGCSVCAIGVAGHASVHELYDTKQAIRIISFMGSITILAPALGPLFGSLVLELGSWRLIFSILAIWAAASCISLFICMPETCPREKRTSFNLSVLLTNYRTIIQNKLFMANTLIYCLISVGIIGWITISSLLIMVSFKQTALHYGLIQALIFCGFIIASRVVQKKISTIAKEKFIHAGLFLTVFSALASLFIAFLFPTCLVGFVCALVIYATGGALMFGALARSAIDACTEPMGLRLSVFSTIVSIIIALGSIFASAIYDGSLLSFACVLMTVTLLACLIKLHCLYKNTTRDQTQ